MIPTVIFAHGRETGPWGVKIRALARVSEAHGCRVISQDDRDTMDPDLRAERLVEAGRAVDSPLVLVGSSMGGYAATVASDLLRPAGLFLMAPAVGLSGYRVPDPAPTAELIAVVHGWDDDVVPLANVLEFSRRHRLFCHLAPAGHTLREQLPWLTALYTQFLRAVLQRRETDAGRRLASLL